MFKTSLTKYVKYISVFVYTIIKNGVSNNKFQNIKKSGKKTIKTLTI